MYATKGIGEVKDSGAIFLIVITRLLARLVRPMARGATSADLRDRPRVVDSNMHATVLQTPWHDIPGNLDTPRAY